MKSGMTRIVGCIVACMGALCFGLAHQEAVAQEPANLPYAGQQVGADVTGVTGHFHIDGQYALPE